MAAVEALFRDATNFANEAVNWDKRGNSKAAAFYYVEAAAALLQIDTIDSSQNTRDKAFLYIGRAEELKKMVNNGQQLQQISVQQENLDKAKFLMQQGLLADEMGNDAEAVPLYRDAVELCLATSKELPADDEMKKSLMKVATQALERAEALKGNPPVSNKPTKQANKPGTVGRQSLGGTTVGLGSVKSSSKPGRNAPMLTQKELDVLRLTSYINNRVYKPFLDVDVMERFAYSDTYDDPDGKLALSPKQKAKFARWVRPSELCDEPCMIYAVSSFSIRQTIVSDCSFVASLAISAAYERHFRKQLITSIIYPQNREGKPVYNPSGKYMIKLRLNGIPRKVIVDDTLPMGKNGELLCSYSSNRNELWVSLVEKAYMKVMGGYDFPGSNSNIDLHVLTGWIPERISIKLDKADFNKDLVFDRLLTGLKKGDCLITVATGVMSEADADRAGLVPTHAYALLDINNILGKKMIQLKNPWSHLRWKGRYSENDTSNWTPELQRALNYDRLKAVETDNGVFWLDWDCLLHFFDVIYVNWNPKLFAHRYILHSTWNAKEGPVKDLYNLGPNPQYRLEVNAGDQPAVVWILLTRHITEKEDFADNKEYITMHLFKSDGNRVYYPDGAVHEGTKINSPHYLVKLNTSSGKSRYTLVISQYEKNNTIHYTVKVFSSAEFKLAPVQDLCVNKREIAGEWTKETAGGQRKANPVYCLELDPSAPPENLSIIVMLKAPRQYFVGLHLTSLSDPPQIKAIDKYRSGFCVLEWNNAPRTAFHIVPSTFREQQLGQFIIIVKASCKFKLTKL